MANITATMVNGLRQKTGAGMMDCKKALVQAEGNEERAIEILREKGLADAGKKSGRIASEGIVASQISSDNKTGILIELNCETDFVAANEEFKNLAKAIANQYLISNCSDLDSLLNEKLSPEDVTVKDAVVNLIARLKENMTLRRAKKMETSSGAINSYIHAGGKIGVLVKLECNETNDTLLQLGKDIAMQIAAANPTYLDRDSIDEDILKKEREIYKVQAMNEGKPEKIAEKMVEGKIQKFYKEKCLLEQVWVRDQEYTIKKLIAEKSKEIGCEIKCTEFVRFERGEGIEKEVEDFASEVQKQIKGNN
ncbi:MAG: translation elongation factor Ts [Oscillospiraceae bacterium]|nr:translation elongation factor Ts [Oscillospiraceae bacterium]